MSTRVMRFFVDREQLQSIALVGYSMGGNLVMKLAGELGARAACAVAFGRRRLARSRPRPIGQWHCTGQRTGFTRGVFCALCSDASAARQCSFPVPTIPIVRTGITSLRDFDDRITALYSGFFSAEDYYFRAAAARVVDRIAVPTLILRALDDPFIQITPKTLAALQANPNITLLQPRARRSLRLPGQARSHKRR